MALQERHRSLAFVLDSSGSTDPEMLAVHFQGPANQPRPGITYVLAAAQATDALAFDRAAKQKICKLLAYHS